MWVLLRGLRGSVTSPVSWATGSDGLDSVPVSECGGRLHLNMHACMQRYRSCSDCLVCFCNLARYYEMRSDMIPQVTAITRDMLGLESWAVCTVIWALLWSSLLSRARISFFFVFLLVGPIACIWLRMSVCVLLLLDGTGK
jgi:hypothetical protein